MKNTSTKTRLITIGAVSTAMLGGGLATASSANAASGSTWDRVAACESGGNWSISTGNGFSGGLQFTPSTWRAYGGQGNAKNASRAQQIAVAERVLAGQGPGAWPVCSKKAGLTRGGNSSATPQRAAKKQTSRSETRSTAKKQTTAPKASVKKNSAKKHSVSKQNTSKRSVEQRSTTKRSTPQQSTKKHTSTQRQVTPKVSAKSTGRTITVQAGDTLGKLAQKYDIKGGWKGLFAMNKGSINNPNLIFVGQHLTV